MKKWKWLALLDAMICLPGFILACWAAVIEIRFESRIILLSVAVFALLVMIPSLYLAREKLMPLILAGLLSLLYITVLIWLFIGFALLGGFSEWWLVLIVGVFGFTITKSLAVALHFSK